jgi:hypothetical protein
MVFIQHCRLKCSAIRMTAASQFQEVLNIMHFSRILPRDVLEEPSGLPDNAGIQSCPVWHRKNDRHQLTFEEKGYVASGLVVARALLAKTVCG